MSIPFQTFENGDAQLEFIDAVLSLNVTPHITADRSIIMKVEVSRNAPDEQRRRRRPARRRSRKNQADTETLVKDGQTLVIGGIYVIETADTAVARAVPALDPACSGRCSAATRSRDRRKELLIFVTPRIVRPEVAS